MTDLPNAVMLFAAGFGTRMRPLTDEIPKPMVELGGRPLIDRALELVSEVEPANVVVNTHYKPEPLEAHLSGRGVTVLREEPNILDTGGGLRNALPQLGTDPVWTMNPDVVWIGPNPLEFTRKYWRPAEMDALLVCVPVENCISRSGEGDFTVSASGALSRGGSLVYGGVQIIKTEILHSIKEAAFSLNRIWDLYIADGRCHGCIYPGSWCDIGSPDGLETAKSLIAAQS